MDQIEPILGHSFVDDVKMASAVAIAAAVMIPAILAFAFVSWLIRCCFRGLDCMHIVVTAPASSRIPGSGLGQGAAIDARAIFRPGDETEAKAD